MKTITVCALFVMIACSGCGWAPFAVKEAITESKFIRNVVVADDWVYVRENDTLYRRYVPGRGIGPLRVNHGNHELLSAVDFPSAPGFIARHTPFDGKITRSNTSVIVYGNYSKARQAHPDAIISSESLALVPRERVAPEWWTERLREKPWEP